MDGRIRKMVERNTVKKQGDECVKTKMTAPKSTDSNYNTYSLAITCHRCGINVFEYLCDIIDRCAAWFPNTSIEKYRDLLPGKWKQTQK